MEQSRDHGVETKRSDSETNDETTSIRSVRSTRSMISSRSTVTRGESEFNSELWQLAKLAIALMVAAATEHLGTFLTTIVAGHILSTDEFDGVALGFTMTNITGYAMIIAFASPMDSLCTQAMGARNWKLFSLTVHRALACNALFLIPTVILWLNMDKVLILCGQDPVIAIYVYQWTLVYLSMLPAYTIQTIIVRFLSSQSIAKPLFYIGIVVYIIWHPLLLCLVFIGLRKTDFVWFPLCNVVTAYVQIMIQIGYIIIARPHEPLTFQQVSLSEIFRWKANPQENAFVDEPINLQVIDKGLSEYIQLLFAGLMMHKMCRN